MKHPPVTFRISTVRRHRGQRVSTPNPAEFRVRSVKVVYPDGRFTRTVVGPDGLPIECVETFLNYLRTTGSSANTVSSYANHLSLFFRWAIGRGLLWAELDFEGLCQFVQDLQDGSVPSWRASGVPRYRPRSRATTEAVLAALSSFLEYWRLEGVGPQDLRLYRDSRSARHSTFSFLAHVEQRRVRQERRIRLRGPKSPAPRTINFEDDFGRLLEAATTCRDRALLALMFDGGLRIGQALGLRHEDLELAARRVHVVRREDNANGALSKQRASFEVQLTDRFFAFYGHSLVDEQLPKGIESDYVFVNLAGPRLGRPMTYSNALQIVRSIGRKAGIDLTPHMLRHTHATALAKHKWTQAEVAKRLGHSSPTSAAVYTHLSDDDIHERYQETFGDPDRP